MDHLLHPVVSIRIFFALAYYIQLLCDWSFHLHHHITYICYFIVLSIFALTKLWCCCCAAIRRDSVSLLRLPFLYHVQVFSCDISLVCRLKCSYSCFSSLCPFFDCSYFVDACVVCISSGRWNQSSSAFLNVIFESLYRCIDVIFNADDFYPFSFPWHKLSVYVTFGMYGLMYRHKFFFFLFFAPFVEVPPSSTSKMDLVSDKGDSPGVHPSGEILAK